MSDQQQPARITISGNRVCLVLALICFILAAFGIGQRFEVGLIPLGLAFMVLAGLV